MRDAFDLTQRRALVTGASMGIGLALARGLAAHGAQVTLNARREGPLGEAADALAAEGFDVATAAFDVTDREAVRDAVARIEAEAPLDILVNNAGVQFRKPLHEFPDAEWERLFRVNVDGVYNVARAVADGMIARGRGRIVNVASINSLVARASVAPYTATKGAVLNLTRGMAADWARFGLNCNALAPGFMRTPLTEALQNDPDFDAWLRARTPQGRWGEVGELAGACVFLASDAASFVNGQVIYVDGGITAAL